jgi:D-serine deaminase-like pyridoxal phosphate-dependent protein
VLTVRERYAVSDAGMKSLSQDHGPSFSRDGSFRAAGLSEEHAHLRGEGIASLHAGDRVELVPSHADTTLNMHDVYNVVRNGELVDQWPILGARKFQ